MVQKYAVPPAGGRPAAARYRNRLKAELHLYSKGFTMIELLVVMAIIAVIATISVPTVQSMTSPKHALRKEGRKVMHLMTEARTAAMARKARVELHVDPAAREIRLVEAQAYFTLPQEEDPDLFHSADVTNIYEKVVALKEDFSIDSFSADQINGGEDADPFRETTDLPIIETEELPPQHVVAFTHLGGSNGGGVSLIKDGVRLDIAADILTGRPKIVTREREE